MKKDTKLLAEIAKKDAIIDALGDEYSACLQNLAEERLIKDRALQECARLKITWYRYEKLRRLNPRQFQALWDNCLKNNKKFDDEVDKLE